ncbi:MAG: Bacterial SH3 domain [Rhodobacteraceae bacterium HLUCCA12]|nr:MAG: Bacterial SH3 domain [Rhodobacteraceae bacterium HLUCCA12]
MRNSLSTLAGLILAALVPVSALAGDCTGHVVDVRPISAYDPATGRGYLAVRSGPGTEFRQIGELYLGDEVAVWERSGNWLMVRCMAGRCLAPMRGDPVPTGWAFGRYLRIGGVCP